MRNFQEQCPHCLKRVYDINGMHADRDYATNFVFACPHCGKPIDVTVHMVAEFEFIKAETPEEYQARRQAMIERQKQGE